MTPPEWTQGNSQSAPVPTPSHVAILGLGLIGGSIALALRGAALACRVTAFDTNADATDLAISVGAIDSAAASPAEAVEGAGLVILAVPVTESARLLREALPAISADAFATDVGSVKGRVVRECEALLPKRFVGGHPMAGSERWGFAASRKDLFARAPWVLTPVESTLPDAVEAAGWLVETVGAEPCFCDPDTHDHLVAALSHLPHVLGFGMAQVAGDRVSEPWTRLAAGSLRDGTRVARALPGAWASILMDNRIEVTAALDAFICWAEQARQLLRESDTAELHRLLALAHEQAARFPQR